MASTRAKRRGKTRTQRYTSNIFSIFNENQIREFQEAFDHIDGNKDKLIDKYDLRTILTHLGKDPTDEELDEMLGPVKGQLNFTMFLTLFGEKMTGSDPEETMLSAFSCFDPEGTGLISEERLRHLMSTTGQRWNEDQLDELFHRAPIDNGMLDYKKFTKMMMHGQDEDEEIKTDQ